MFSAYRLAKFNVDTEQSYNFKGIPTPINALVFCAVPFLLDHPFLGEYVSNPRLLVGFALFQSFMLVSDRPFMAIKFKNYSIKETWNKYAFFTLSFLSLLLFQYFGILIIYGLYIFLSLFTIRNVIES